MAPVKSSFMFLVKPGKQFEFELEPFYFNNTSKALEPLSAASKTVPRDKKVPFGPVEKLFKVDEEILEILNIKEEKIQLLRSKLSPLLDNEDSMLKNLIFQFHDKSTDALIAALNSLVEKFHESENCRKHLDSVNNKGDVVNTEDIVKDSDTEDVSERSLLEDEMKCSSVSLLSKNSSKRCSLRLSKNSSKRCSLQVSSAGSFYSDKSKKAKTDERDSDETEYSDEELNKETKEIDDDATLTEKEDLMKRIGAVISEARFMGIKCDRCEIPTALLIDRDTVARLKESLVKHPDKTQCIVGVVGLADSDDVAKPIGNYQVFVNAELFLAVQELSFEGFDFYGKDKGKSSTII